MKKAELIRLAGAVLTSIFIISLLIVPLATAAPPNVVAIPGVSFNTSSPLKDNLQSLVGKNVYLNLRSGKSYQGFIKSVSDHFVHLEKIVGRDFYDALIRIEDISAVEARFRDYKK